MLSKVVPEYCNATTQDDQRTSSVDYLTSSRNQFEQLMTHLPSLDHEAAMPLMQTDRSLQCANGINAESDSDEVRTTMPFENKYVTVLAMQWRKGMLQRSTCDDEALIVVLQGLSPKFLAKLLVTISRQYELDMVTAEEAALNAKQENLIPNHPRDPTCPLM